MLHGLLPSPTPTPTRIIITPAELINGGFEQGPGAGWRQASTNGRPLIVTALDLPSGLLPYRGSWAAWLGGVPGETAAIEQRASVPRLEPYLVYWRLVRPAAGCADDRAWVLINSATVAASHSLCTGTPNGTWQRAAVNLSRYAGQSVLIQFRAQTEASASSLFIDELTFSSDR